ncbi:hypothetical protein [Sphingomonas sp. IBVSS2]|nr:hypothetical protein [Sphingomonas sp. IBVSS2]
MTFLLLYALFDMGALQKIPLLSVLGENGSVEILGFGIAAAEP